MKLLKTFAAVLIVTVALSTVAFAGDYATLNFIGFSKDGKYLAFEEYGTSDGAGFPYSNYYFIDTARNTFAAPRISVYIENETSAEAAARAKAGRLAAAKLRQYRIIKGNTGKLVVSRLLTDMTDGNEKGGPIQFAAVVGSMYHEGDYELDVKQVKVTTKECENYGDDTFMLDMTLRDREAGTTRVLQKDASLPASRGCVRDYSVQDIYLYEGVAAVFMNIFTQGFEGPDMRYMVVTGRHK